MTSEVSTPRSLRAFLILGFAGGLAACASPGPERQVYAPPPPYAAQPYATQPPYAAQPNYAAQPPAVQPRVTQAPIAQPPRAAPPRVTRAPVVQPRVAQAPVVPPQPPVAQKVAIGGTAFPVDGSAGSVPVGSRLVVRVYDAAGGDVNVRAAEGAFRVADGLPVRYTVPVPAKALGTMELPAVAARIEGPRGGVIYRNETAVLLKQGAPGDIPMTLQRRTAASAVTVEWTAPKAE